MEAAKAKVHAQKHLRKQAIIIGGATLGQIKHNDTLKALFLEATDDADVVLACRVSPRQKAEVVEMVRFRYN